MKSNLLILGTLLCVGTSVGAQQVYKCASQGAVTYSERPCSKRAVNTEQADVPVKPNPKEVDLRRMEQNRVLARSLRQRSGESAEQFETRRRRARMMETDRDECARIDVRMPVEQEQMKNPDSEEVLKAEAALAQSRKRFAELGC
jgi:hypothetical protein